MSDKKVTSANKSPDAEEQRERKPLLGKHYDANAGNGEVQAQRQKDAIERHNAQLAENERRHLAQSLPNKLSTSGFVGKVANEPDKHDHVEARKRGEVGNGPGVATPVEFETIDQHENGEHVDTIVTNILKDKGVPGATPLNEPQKVQAALDEHFGEKKAEVTADEKREAEEKVAGADT